MIHFLILTNGFIIPMDRGQIKTVILQMTLKLFCSANYVLFLKSRKWIIMYSNYVEM